MNTNNLLNSINLQESVSDISKGTILALIIIGVVLLLLLSIAAIYLIASLRRRNVVLKKIDYLVEDITYKSESLNVTVETINKISNYILSLDAVTQTGFKSAVKLISENKNYIYAIMKKLQTDVEKRKDTSKKSGNTKVDKKPVAAKKPSTAKKTTTAKKPNTSKKK